MSATTFSNSVFLVLPTIAIQYKFEVENHVVFLAPNCGKYEEIKWAYDTEYSSMFAHRKKIYGIRDSKSYRELVDCYENKIIDQLLKTFNNYFLSNIIESFPIFHRIRSDKSYTLNLDEDIPKFMEFSDIHDTTNFYILDSRLTQQVGAFYYYTPEIQFDKILGIEVINPDGSGYIVDHNLTRLALFPPEIKKQVVIREGMLLSDGSIFDRKAQKMRKIHYDRIYDMTDYGLIISESNLLCKSRNILLFQDGYYTRLSTTYFIPDEVTDISIKIVYENPFENNDILKLSKYISTILSTFYRNSLSFSICKIITEYCILVEYDSKKAVYDFLNLAKEKLRTQ